MAYVEEVSSKIVILTTYTYIPWKFCLIIKWGVFMILK